jgi:fused signal recognition particle receptor
MALRAWIDRLRGKGEAPAPAPEETTSPPRQADTPPPGQLPEQAFSPPPGQLPEPVPPSGAPTLPPPAAPDIPVPPLPPEPPPYTAPSPLERLTTAPAPEVQAPPEPAPEVSPRDDAAALREAEAATEPEPPAEQPGARGGWLARLRGGRPPEPEAPPSPPEPLEVEPAPEAEEPQDQQRGGWFTRLRAGLSRSTARLTESVTGLFNRRRLDDAALEELEETLIAADLGVSASQRIVEGFRRTRFGKEVTDEEVKAALAEEIAAILEPVAQPMEINPTRAPHVVLVVGVNGTGKTTTIAKLGQQYRAQGLTCAFVAGDTFRAAAVEQLQIWGGRTGAHVYAPARDGADAAGLAFDALKAAREAGTDVLLVDTAGRLHNKSALMEELRKVVRVMQRVDPTAPHSVLLTLDATTGQNAMQQCKVFKEMVDVTGLAVTKLDGSAKGGIVVALAQEFGLPVHMVGVGEKAEDLRPFTATDYARGLVGLG